jgi:hypothetical protein
MFTYLKGQTVQCSFVSFHVFTSWILSHSSPHKGTSPTNVVFPTPPVYHTFHHLHLCLLGLVWLNMYSGTRSYQAKLDYHMLPISSSLHPPFFLKNQIIECRHNVSVPNSPLYFCLHHSNPCEKTTSCLFLLLFFGDHYMLVHFVLVIT